MNGSLVLYSGSMVDLQWPEVVQVDETWPLSNFRIMVHEGVDFTSQASLTAAAGTEIIVRLAGQNMGGVFKIVSTSSAAMAGLEHLTLRCDFEDDEVAVDIAGDHNRIAVELMTDNTDWPDGRVIPIASDFVATNFALGKLIVGRDVDDEGDPIADAAGQAIVELADGVDNYPGGGTATDMLLVCDLHILAGGGFDVGGTVVDGVIVGEYQLWYIATDGAPTTNPQQLFPGDADLDGDVDLDDFVLVKQNFDVTTGATWGAGDFDGDRDVDLDDFVMLKNFFARTSPVAPPPDAAPAGGGPASMMMAPAPLIPPISDLDGDGDIDFDDFCILLEQTQGQ